MLIPSHIFENLKSEFTTKKISKSYVTRYHAITSSRRNTSFFSLTPLHFHSFHFFHFFSNISHNISKQYLTLYLSLYLSISISSSLTYSKVSARWCRLQLNKIPYLISNDRSLFFVEKCNGHIQC